jgi:hypothetical protein
LWDPKWDEEHESRSHRWTKDTSDANGDALIPSIH